MNMKVKLMYLSIKFVKSCMYAYVCNTCVYVCMYDDASPFRLHFKLRVNSVMYKLNEKLKCTDIC